MKLYWWIGAGLLGFSLAVGVSSRKDADSRHVPENPLPAVEATAQAESTPPVEASAPTEESAANADIPLEDKLRTILGNLSARFKEGEINTLDYGEIVFAQLKGQGILSGIYLGDKGDVDWDNVHATSDLIHKFGKKLSVEEKKGLTADYWVTPSTPISGEARGDIAALKNLEGGLLEYLRQNPIGTSVTEDEMEAAVRRYAVPKMDAAGVEEMQKCMVLGSLYWIAQNRAGIKVIVPEEPVGSYTESSIDQALEMITVE